MMTRMQGQASLQAQQAAQDLRPAKALLQVKAHVLAS